MFPVVTCRSQATASYVARSYPRKGTFDPSDVTSLVGKRSERTCNFTCVWHRRSAHGGRPGNALAGERSCARSSSAASTKTRSSSSPPTGPAGSAPRSPRRSRTLRSSGAGPTGSGTCPGTPARRAARGHDRGSGLCRRGRPSRAGCAPALAPAGRLGRADLVRPVPLALAGDPRHHVDRGPASAPAGRDRPQPRPRPGDARTHGHVLLPARTGDPARPDARPRTPRASVRRRHGRRHRRRLEHGRFLHQRGHPQPRREGDPQLPPVQHPPAPSGSPGAPVLAVIGDSIARSLDPAFLATEHDWTYVLEATNSCRVTHLLSAAGERSNGALLKEEERYEKTPALQGRLLAEWNPTIDWWRTSWKPSRRRVSMRKSLRSPRPGPAREPTGRGDRVGCARRHRSIPQRRTSGRGMGAVA